jgi:glucokinase
MTTINSYLDADCFLVADIGGTNARLAIASGSDFSLTQEHTFQCAEFDSLADIVRAWQDAANCPMPQQACFAIAGPISGSSHSGSVKMTNLNWEFSVHQLKQELDLSELHAINDFAAMANAAVVLGDDDLFSLKSGSACIDAPLAIIGPGTGFGAAALVPNKHQWITMPGEGGHAAFAPTTELERELLTLLSQKYQHVSVETLLCGRGLVDIYQALCQLQNHALPQNYSPSDITEQGLHDRDNLCVQTLDVFCGILGSTAADIALTYGARGGVFIGGGIVPRLRGFIESSNFCAHFINKGVMSDYAKSIPVQVMIAEQPALVGAAAWLANRDGPE